MKEIVYCTYFDKYYLLKGLALYSSLVKHNPGAKLWILCMDQFTYKILNKMNLVNVKLITKKEFEDDKLLKIKRTRTSLEYYWSCTPSLPLYVLDSFKTCDYVIYIDSDMFFYSSSDPIFDELSHNSIYLVEHRYPPDQIYRISKQGRFNVGILVFKNDSQSRKCLERWRDQCIDWCYFREEEGKMGDQMYLNEWPRLYDKLTISQNLGVNAAPWNIAQNNVRKKDDKILIGNYNLVCYHFHQFKIINAKTFIFAKGYELSSHVTNIIYKPYLDEIKTQFDKLKPYSLYFNCFDSISRLKSVYEKVTKFLIPH